MKTLLLPGVNPATIEWLDLVFHKLELSSKQPFPFEYSFWSDKDDKPSLKKEIGRLPAQKFDLIIAKSFGTLVLLQALLEGRLSCDSAILFGIPIKIATDVKGFQAEEAFKQLADSSFLLIQQQEDKLGHAKLLLELQPANLLTIPGNDHQYNELDHYIEKSKSWLMKKSSGELIG
ncbi:hypothetical protein [Desulfosediminicola ganghwensis]|uniref:hypothetical protein n=1 Tax=Desulfosediminicola ganghwensis TaxID=2569540 RepID=UPI0010AC8D8A|nr:hypothetical protein [Desulfosediminicola ganghwensis]